MERQFLVEAFLFKEARLLDERAFGDWLDLLTDDVHYWMPIRRTTTAAETDAEFTRQGGMAFFDDDKTTLKMRVDRLTVGKAWAEDPPSRTRRLVTNIEILDDDGRELIVRCNFQLHRNRLNSEEDVWVGRREDVLRRHGDDFLLSKRTIYLEQTVILAQNMSSLF